MMCRYMSGAGDYDWNKWPSSAFPLTRDLQDKAAAIADKFTTAADVQKYFETSTDPVNLKMVVQYAVTARKQPIKDVTDVVSSSATEAPKGKGIYVYNFGLKKDETPPPPPPAEKKETPVLLYAIGAAVLFAILKK